MINGHIKRWDNRSSKVIYGHRSSWNLLARISLNFIWPPYRKNNIIISTCYHTTVVFSVIQRRVSNNIYINVHRAALFYSERALNTAAKFCCSQRRVKNMSLLNILKSKSMVDKKKGTIKMSNDFVICILFKYISFSDRNS